MEKRQTQEELRASALEQLERMRELAKNPKIVRKYVIEMPLPPKYLVRYSVDGMFNPIIEHYADSYEQAREIGTELEKTYPTDDIYLIQL